MKTIVVRRSAAPARAASELARVQGRLMAVRARAKERVRAAQHTAVAAASAALVGALARSRAARGESLPSIAGLDPLLAYGAGAWLAATVLPGRASELAAAAADGLLAVYAFQLASRER